MRTRLTERLGIEHPLLNAPMAGTAGADLAAAVSEAGGLGMIGGTVPGGADAVRAMMRRAREQTDRPVGVGFISSFPGLEAAVAAAIEAGASVIAHSFVDPTPLVGPVHAAGLPVLAQVQTVAAVRVAAEAGVDLIAAQGTEAGGHTGYLGTLSFVAAAVDAAGDVPVIAAGGIGDGRTFAAALMLGAEGAWIGTRFVASHEALGAAWIKARVVAAGADDTVLTRVYDLISQAPFPPGIGDRVLRNTFTAEWIGREDAVAERREELAARLDEASRAGRVEELPARAGGAAALIDSIEPAGEIVRKLVADAEQVLRQRPAAVLR